MASSAHYRAGEHRILTWPPDAFYMLRRLSSIPLLRSFVGVSGLYMLGIPLLLLANIVLARTLSVADFGTFGFALSLASVLAIPVSGGLPMLLTREVSTYVQRGNWPAYRGLVAEAYRWVMLVSLAIGSAFLTWSVAFGGMPAQYLLAAFVLVPIMGLNTIRTGILRGFGRSFLAETPSQVLQPTLLILGYLVLALLGLTTAANALWWYVAVNVMVFGVASIMLWRVQPLAARTANTERTDKLRWRRALFPFMMISATTLLSTQVAVLIAGFLGQEEVVAYLRVAERGAMFIIISFHVLSSIIGPHMVAAIQSGDIERQREVVAQSSRLMFFTSFPLAICISLMGPQILGLLFGSPYEEMAYLPMVIISVSHVFLTAFGHIGMFLSMGGHERLTLASQVLGLGVNVALCIFLIGPLGAVGAAIGISAGGIASTAMNAFLVKRHFGFIPGMLLRRSYQ